VADRPYEVDSRRRRRREAVFFAREEARLRSTPDRESSAATEMEIAMPGKKWSFFENGMPGLHLTINPQKPLPPEARVVQHFANQGITLSDRERDSILRGRSEGVGTVKTILDRVIPGFAPDKRLKFANQIVDALLDKSTSAQLSREAPSPQDQFQAETDKLNAVLRAPSPTLLQQVPVGVSVTIHFDSLLGGRR
jgi:hypothetical protein